jgi:hypothetical protein
MKSDERKVADIPVERKDNAVRRQMLDSVARKPGRAPRAGGSIALLSLSSWRDEARDQRVTDHWTTCHLGGQRPWFICSVFSMAIEVAGL